MTVAAFKIGLVLLILLIFLRATSLAGEKCKISPELLRKAVHIGLGLTCLTFPWLFATVCEIVILGVAVTAVLGVIRSRPALRVWFGGGLYGVERNSAGDLLFGLAVVFLFIAARSEPALYVLPLLIMTLADSAAALAGVSFGRHSFVVPAGRKSWEGMLAFFGVTVLLVTVILQGLTDTGPAEAVGVALIMGLVICMAEAVAWHGLDNLLVPLGSYLLLGQLAGKNFSQLAVTLLFLVTSIILALKFSAFSRLSTHSLIGAVMAAFFFWATGGPLWLAGPLIVFLLHILLSALKGDESDDGYGIQAVMSVVFCGVIWRFVDSVFVNPIFGFTGSFFLFNLAMAIHFQIILLLRIRGRRQKKAEYPLVTAVSLVAGWMYLPPLLLFYNTSPLNPAVYLSGWLIMAVGGLALTVREDGNTGGRWLQQTLLALGGSALGLIPLAVFS